MGSSRRHPNQRFVTSLPPELRRTRVPPPVRAWIARETGVAVARVRRLPGASSSAVHGIGLADGSRLVLRRYVWPGFLIAEPMAPVREVDALAFAHGHGLAVPEVIAADADGTQIGDGVPALLMSFLPGRAIALPDLHLLAEVAAAIHSVDPRGFGHDFFRWYEGTTIRAPAASKEPQLWEAAIGLWNDATPEYRAAFVHRDFHPGNVLWSRGRASGIVDWANACRGPRGCDIAHCRDNLVSLSGVDAADRFTAAYESVTGEPFDPYWQIASILEHEPSAWTAESLALTEPMLAQAVGYLREQPPRRRYSFSV